MVDMYSKEKRSEIMSRCKGKDTKPEMIIRSLVHRMGYRYRLHVRKLPGNPDLVFPSRKKVVFVHGCFWHLHNCRKGRDWPATRKRFWEKKLEGNKERDKKNRRKLRKQGWKVLTIWECQIRKPEKIAQKIVDFLEDK